MGWVRQQKLIHGNVVPGNPNTYFLFLKFQEIITLFKNKFFV